MFQHVNKVGLVVHGCVKGGLWLAFFGHVWKDTNVFVLEHLRLGFSIYQTMDKHKVQVKEIMENNNKLTTNLILNEEDICNLAGKLAKETYKLEAWKWCTKSVNVLDCFC